MKMKKIFALIQFGSDTPKDKSENYRLLAKERDELNNKLKKDEKPYYCCIWLYRFEIK